MLSFCKEADNFLDKLLGLPLLLTQDNRLQSFSNVGPKFLSRFEDLLPGSPQIFLHQEIYWKIFCFADTSKLTVLKPLDAGAFADNLAETLPREMYGKCNYVQWSPAQKEVPNQRWISRVWEFFYDILKEVLDDAKMDDECKVRQVKAIIHPLLDWSILPATQISFRTRRQLDHFLLPLRRAEGAIDLVNVDAASVKVTTVLRKLGIPELNRNAISCTSLGAIVYSSSTSLGVALMLVSSLKVPSSLLASLLQKLMLNQQEVRERLKESDCEEILEYFSRSISCLRECDEGNLRKLPFYLATNGGFLSLDEVPVSALPNGVPRKEIDVLERALGMAFVKSWPSVRDLYKFLKLKSISAVDVYCNWILPNFSLLSEEGRQVHLKYIRDTILTESTVDDEEKERLLDILKRTPLIPSEDGTLKTASCVYNRNNDVFRAMLSEEDFLPESFDSPEWRSFLERLGFVSEVSSADFRKFAMEVEHEALTEQSEDTYMKSKILVDHLMSWHDVVGEGLLKSICNIAFVACDPVADSLKALCPPYKGRFGDQIPYIPFKGAFFAGYKEIIWTQAYSLPKWADPKIRRHELGCPPLAPFKKYCDAFVSQLQIVKVPPIGMVVRHCEVICRHLENRCKCGFDLSKHHPQIMNIMDQIYTYLQGNEDREANIVLKVTPCILVENGTKFVTPGEVVFELRADEEIKPFLYRFPLMHGRFRKLFQRLGCCDSVSCAHYAMVLEKLRKKCCDAKLHPNELKICLKAIMGFFKTLQENSEEAFKFSTLYLPAMPSGIPCKGNDLNTIPVTLHKSTELMFNDVPAYEDRIKELHQPFVLDLKLMEVIITQAMTNFKELMMKLPLRLRPKMLSFVVKEKLTHGVSVKSGVFNLLMLRLFTPQFGRGIVRIIKHDNSQKRDFDEGVIADIEKGLKQIQLCAIDNLKTALYLDDIFIPGSERYTKSFREKSVISGVEKSTVYVNVVNGTKDTELARSSVSGVIVDMCGDLIGKSAYPIPSMLQCAPNEIWSLLDKSDIRQDDTYRKEDMYIFPDPGTFIPVEDHHLLNVAFCDFEPGEYVGYQLEDPSLQLERGAATFIYAVVIEEVITKDVNFNEDWVLHLVTKVYSVDIGHEHEPVEVTAAKLYKFYRLEEISDAQRECPKRRSREKVFLEISTILENAWKFYVPKCERDQIVMRLVLEWRPEKNEDDEEFCSEVSEYIKAELLCRDKSYEDRIKVWVERAEEHKLHREKYKKKISKEDTSLWIKVPPSFSSFNPQPSQAKRWCRQAEADLMAGRNEIDSIQPSYEWACYKCHQAAEKALKAAQYTIDANNTRIHDLRQICHGLNDAEIANFASQLENHLGSYTRMRYPDCICSSKIPNEIYSSQDALKALELATEIITRVKTKIQDALDAYDRKEDISVSSLLQG